MKQKRTKDILIHLSRKYDLPVWLLKEMVEAQFDMVRKVMEDGDKYKPSFKTIRLYKFGLFYVSPGKIKFYERCNKERENKTISTEPKNHDQNINSTS